MEKREDAYVQHTNYTDLPLWQQEEWLGDIALQEVEAMKKYDYEQYKHIYLGLNANLKGGIYKKFDRKLHTGGLTHKYIKLTVGVDYGERDATVFTTCGITESWKSLEIPHMYYHKNGVSRDKKDINEYSRDLIEYCEEMYNLYGLRVDVYIDPANLSFKNLFEKIKQLQGKSFIQIKQFNKLKIDKKEKNGIQERVNIMNLMLGANYIKINPELTELIKAIEHAEYDNNGDRLDDGSFSVDNLDSFEYGWKTHIPTIKKIIISRKETR
jgi:hypothetical protein